MFIHTKTKPNIPSIQNIIKFIFLKINIMAIKTTVPTLDKYESWVLI